jgi:hypothetical protein
VSDIAKLFVWNGEPDLKLKNLDVDMDKLYERLKAEMAKRHAIGQSMFFSKTLPDLSEIFIGVDPGDQVNRPTIMKVLKAKPQGGERLQFVVLDSYCGFKE